MSEKDQEAEYEKRVEARKRSLSGLIAEDVPRRGFLASIIGRSSQEASVELPQNPELPQSQERRKALKKIGIGGALLAVGSFLSGAVSEVLPKSSATSGNVVFDNNEIQANDYIIDAVAQLWKINAGVQSNTSLDFQAFVSGAYSDYVYMDISNTILGTLHNKLDYTDTNGAVGSASFLGNISALGNASSIIGDVNIANSGTMLSAHAARHGHGGADPILSLGAITLYGTLNANSEAITSLEYLQLNAISDSSIAGKFFLSSTTQNTLKYYDTASTPALHLILTEDNVSTYAVSSVSNSDSTLTISPTLGAVVASLNLAHQNTWTALQTFNAGISGSGNLGALTAGSGILSTANTWTGLQTFGTDISLLGAQVSGSLTTGNFLYYNGTNIIGQSLSSPNSTLNISDYTLDLNLAHSNTWTSAQTIQTAFDTDSLILQIVAPSSSGGYDSPYLHLVGYGYDTSAHEVDWHALINVTSNAGASTFLLQSRIGTATFGTRLAISDGGVITTGSWEAGAISNTYLAGPLVSSLTTETAAGITLTATNPSGVGAGYYTPSISVGGDISGTTLSSLTVAKWQGYTLTLSSPTTNQVPVWTGSAWENQDVPATAGVTSLNTLVGALTIASPNSTLSISTATPDIDIDLNLAHSNTWTVSQTFSSIFVNNSAGSQITLNNTYGTAGSAQTNSPILHFYGTGYTNATGTLGLAGYQFLNSVSGGSATADSISTFQILTPTSLSTEGNVQIIRDTNLSSAGTVNSPAFILSGEGYNTALNEVDWKSYVAVTSQAGASTYHLQSRIGTASFGDILTLTDAGLLTVASLGVTTINSGATIDSPALSGTISGTYTLAGTPSLGANLSTGAYGIIFSGAGSIASTDTFIEADASGGNLILNAPSGKLIGAGLNGVQTVAIGSQAVNVYHTNFADTYPSAQLGDGFVKFGPGGADLLNNVLSQILGTTYVADSLISVQSLGKNATSATSGLSIIPTSPSNTAYVEFVRIGGTNFETMIFGSDEASFVEEYGFRIFNGGTGSLRPFVARMGSNESFRINTDASLKITTPTINLAGATSIAGGFTLTNSGAFTSTGLITANGGLSGTTGTFSGLITANGAFEQVTGAGQVVSIGTTYSTVGASDSLNSPSLYLYGTGYTTTGSTHSLGVLGWEMYNYVTGGTNTGSYLADQSYLYFLSPLQSSISEQGFLLDTQASTSSATLQSSPVLLLRGHYYSTSDKTYDAVIQHVIDSTTPTSELDFSINGTKVLAINSSGNITTGVWEATSISNTYLAGPLVTSLTATNGLSVSGSGVGAYSYSLVLNGSTLSNGSSGLSLNLGNANTWSALQTFGTDISFMGEQVSGSTITTGTFLYDNGTNWMRQALVAGTNISVSNATINVINNPTFSGLVTANAGLSSTTGTFSGLITANGAINVPSGSYYQANGSDVLGWDGSNVILNLANVGNTVVKSIFRPYTDNAYSLGTSGSRWSDLQSIAGTFSSSVGGQAISIGETYDTAGSSQLSSPSQYFYGTGYTTSGTGNALGLISWQIQNTVSGGVSGGAVSNSSLQILAPYYNSNSIWFMELLSQKVPTSAGTLYSPEFLITGYSYDTKAHNIRYGFITEPTVNAGTSSFLKLQYGLDTYSLADIMSLDQSGNMNIGGTATNIAYSSGGVELIRYDGVNVILNIGSVNAVVPKSTVRPYTDNAYALGTSSSRWSDLQTMTASFSGAIQKVAGVTTAGNFGVSTIIFEGTGQGGNLNTDLVSSVIDANNDRLVKVVWSQNIITSNSSNQGMTISYTSVISGSLTSITIENNNAVGVYYGSLVVAVKANTTFTLHATAAGTGASWEYTYSVELID
ncbi:MAG: beta strand repeat-containing protein [Nitrososphaerales archaeon]